MHNKIIFAFIISLFAVSSVFAQVMPSARQDPLIDSQTLLKEVRVQKAELDKREHELKAREEKVKALEDSLIRRERELRSIRDNVTMLIEELSAKQDDEIAKLAKVYSAAKPKAAAQIFVNMELDTATEVFRRMTPNVAGKILNELGKLNPKYASKLTESLKPAPFSDATKKDEFSGK